MINVRKTIRGHEQIHIDVINLVDVMMVLLIFFVATTSFVKETGIDVQRSTAATAEVKDQGNVTIGLSADGSIFMEGKRVDIRRVRGLVERALAEDPKTGVVVIADRDSKTSDVVALMDQCRMAGARNVSLAARRAWGS
ncbi:MAG TPA: biopolymer transporter ExbD [Candidatus Krumholzibacteria bacterium]|nr:biopolymer transporter ExbD [Candidatus Krumholzibacteria bacterium]